MILVTDQSLLNNICLELEKEDILSIDTEFDHRNTYYAILSTIQITYSKGDIIVDVLSNLDLTPLKEVIYNEKILKILHDSRQDLTIFKHKFGSIPNNIFDTQIAANICDISNLSVSYSKLCKILLNVDINKTLQTANWLTRPLRKDLLEYACVDTRYLKSLYKMMSNIINMRNIWNIYEARIENLRKNILSLDEPERIFQRMDIQGTLHPAMQKKLLALIGFREEYAKKANIPRKYCATDYDLIDICKSLVDNSQNILSFISKKKHSMNNRFANHLLKLCEKEIVT